MKHIVIFTDLDGTLLDQNYSFEPARQALQALKHRGIPVVLCTSKTLPEVLHYRRVLALTDPFVIENGGAVYIEPGYFKRVPEDAIKQGEFLMIKFGTGYTALVRALEKLKARGFKVKGFYEMSPEEISKLTGLDLDQAIWAKDRQFDEVFFYEGPEDRLQDLKRQIESMGFTHTFGRLHHIKDDFTKATAVRRLKKLYETDLGEIFTIGLGDGRNDLEMLQEVDLPVVVRRSDGSYDSALQGLKGAYYTTKPGPQGWAEAVETILSKSLSL